MQTEPKQLPFIDYHPISTLDNNEAIRVVVRFRTNDCKDIDGISIKEDGKSVTIKRIESVRKSITLTHRNSIRGAILDPNAQQKTKVFHFDAVTDQEDQKDFYERYAKDNVLEFLKGYNSSILAYGSTGSGKTFTIIGDESIENKILKSNYNDHFEVNEKYGILPRSIETIYEELEVGKAKGIKYNLKCSYLEVYNEDLYDLLCSRVGQGHSTKKPLVRYLQNKSRVNIEKNQSSIKNKNKPTFQEQLIIQECPKKGIVIQNMKEEPVNSYSDIFKCLQKGVNNRRKCITEDNSRSSRSHTIFMLNLEQNMLDQTHIFSRLCIVDLAGSEKLQSNQKNRYLETKNINTSLLTLAKCITHLSKATDKNDKKHVPFRESKLTRILKESLGGNSKTTLICAARFSEKFQEETIQTLRFAREAKKIQNELKVKIVYTEEQLLEQIEKLKIENAQLNKELMALKKKFVEEQSSSDRSNHTESTAGYSSGEIPAPANKKVMHKPLEPSSYLKAKNGISQLKKQTSQIFDDNALIRQDLMDIKIRYDSLKKSSEEQIMQLNKEIKNLNEQLAKNSDNKIKEIEQTIQKLSSKYYQQEQQIQQEKVIIRDVQKVLADSQSSPIPNKAELQIQTDFQRSMEDVEDLNRNNQVGCNLIECINNRNKIQKFENLFIEFEEQYSKLYQENQMSRRILQELSERLKGSSLHDLNFLNDSQIHMFGDNDSDSDSNHNDNEENNISDLTYDEEREEEYMKNINQNIEDFEKNQKKIRAEVQYYRAKVNKYNVLNSVNKEGLEDSIHKENKFAKSETFIPLNLILDDPQSGDKHDEEIKSPFSTILPQENRGSSRRDQTKIKFNKSFLNNSFFRYQSGDKTPNSSFRPYYGGQNQQESTPQNRINQSYQSNASQFSDLIESNFADLDLSRIENSLYDDYEDESISENLYGTHKTQNDQKENNLLNNYSHQKQLFQEEFIPDILNMSDSKIHNNTLKQSESLNLSQHNLSYSIDNSQTIKPTKSYTFGYRRSTLPSKSFKQTNKPQQQIPIQLIENN